MFSVDPSVTSFSPPWPSLIVFVARPLQILVKRRIAGLLPAMSVVFCTDL